MTAAATTATHCGGVRVRPTATATPTPFPLATCLLPPRTAKPRPFSLRLSPSLSFRCRLCARAHLSIRGLGRRRRGGGGDRSKAQARTGRASGRWRVASRPAREAALGLAVRTDGRTGEIDASFFPGAPAGGRVRVRVLGRARAGPARQLLPSGGGGGGRPGRSRRQRRPRPRCR
jgi:hypothetical protein